MDRPTSQNSDPIEILIKQLGSIMSGDDALRQLVAIGPEAIPGLERYLVAGNAQPFALPRCRAVKALGLLGARNSLAVYLAAYMPPNDPVVLLAEDAVRSAVAEELLSWKTNEVYEALLRASLQRPTNGLVQAVGQFRDRRSLPLLFRCLEDDCCRKEAESALRLLLNQATQFAFAYLRGETDLPLKAPNARRRVRSTLKLLSEVSVPEREWKHIEPFLDSKDHSIVLAAAVIGLRQASSVDAHNIFRRVFGIAEHLDWLEEAELLQLTKQNRDVGCCVAQQIVKERLANHERPSWLSRSWRILDAVSDNSISHPQS